MLWWKSGLNLLFPFLLKDSCIVQRLTHVINHQPGPGWVGTGPTSAVKNVDVDFEEKMYSNLWISIFTPHKTWLRP